MAELDAGVSLDAGLVDEIFPFHFVVDRDLRIMRGGRLLPKVCSSLAPATSLLDAFSIHRPRVEPTFSAMQKVADRATFFIDATATKVRMRGRMLYHPDSDSLVFLGSPWFTEIEELRRSHLELRDFTVHDPIVDFLYMVQAKAIALNDATRFSEMLARQRDELRHANEELERASAAKSQFLANTSHELRTPLNGIMGMAEVLLLEDLPQRHRSYAEKIASSARSLLAVVNDVLDLSKIEAGKLTLESVEFDLHEIVHDTAELFAVAAHEKGVELPCVVSLDIARRVVGDPGRLRQVLSNLIGNAVKFTTAGEIAVRVDLDSAAEGAAVLLVSVSDTGMGISREVLPRLFTPFSQADESMSRQHGGTGLGLAICRQLVETMGGTLSVESELGVGSRFEFTMKLEWGSEARRIPSLEGLRIATLTPSATLRGHLRDILQRAGASVDSFERSADAFGAVFEEARVGHPYDCAVIDSADAGMSGLAFAGRMTREATCDPTRCVLLAPLAEPDPPEHAARIDTLLSKPIRARKLLAAVGPNSPRSSDRPRQLRPAHRSLGAHVLVVEDHPVNQEVVTAMLAALGCTSVVASNGKAALDALELDAFDLILMDLQMPELDGYRATEEIRRRAGDAGPRVPIIALSAHAMESDLRRAMDAGMDDYLSKPVAFDVLSRSLERWLGGRGAGAGPADGPREPARSAVNRAAIQELRRYDLSGKELVGRVVRRFLDDLPERLLALRRAANRRDGRAMAGPAHALTGSSALVGAEVLGEIAAELERASLSEDYESVTELFGALESETVLVRAELEAVLREHREGGVSR